MCQLFRMAQEKSHTHVPFITNCMAARIHAVKRHTSAYISAFIVEVHTQQTSLTVSFTSDVVLPPINTTEGRNVHTLEWLGAWQTSE